MYETWSFNYEDRIFATPVITLPIVDRAIEELEWYLSAAPRPCWSGPRRCPGSAAPVRSACRSSIRSGSLRQEADIPVSMHASDCGYQR